MNFKKESGFTLVEVIVVAAIIAILAGILVPMIFSQIDEAKLSRTQADIRSLSSAIFTFRKDVGTWPVNSSDAACTSTILKSDGVDFTASLLASLTAQGYDTSNIKDFSSQLMVDPECYNNWNGPYLGSIDADPWGNPYFLDTSLFSGANSSIILSAGPDGLVNTGLNSTTVSAADIGIRIR